MDRRPHYSRNYSRDHNQNFSRPESSRNWSEEAIRGSWESGYQRSMAASPPDRNSSLRGVTRAEYEAKANMVDRWLGSQPTQDPVRPMDTISDFARTPESSPVISDGSSTFQSRPHLTARQQEKAPISAPPDYYTSSPSRTWKQSPDNGSSSRDATSYTADYDLRGVGSFTDGDRSRRKVKYKPLTNWFDMWLP